MFASIVAGLMPRRVYWLLLCLTFSAPGVSGDLLFYTSFETAPPLGSCSDDFDGDGLVNCVETDTKRFWHSLNTGTDPLNADTDGDGISDGDEVHPVSATLNLRAMGAHPLRQNIFLEYDWFGPNSRCASGHKATEIAFSRMIEGFQNAPTRNPDGTFGITLVVDRGQGGHFTGGNVVADSDGQLDGTVFGSAFRGFKANNFNSEREGYFHYGLSVYNFTIGGNPVAWSGIAELLGDDLVVALRCRQIDNFHSGTIMHELGHNLGLRHGGDTDCAWKPNYNSVMNYRYQLHGVDIDCDGLSNSTFEYSTGVRRDLDEVNGVVESDGVCTSVESASPVAIDFDYSNTSTVLTGYDIQKWNRNGTYGNGTQEQECGAIYSLLTDHDDWSNIVFGGPMLTAAGLGSFIVTESEPCVEVP